MSDILDAVNALGESTQEMQLAKESFEAIRQDSNDAINDVNTNFAEKAASLTIVATDGYRRAVEDASGGRNTVIYDAQGNPNIMVVIPRFNCEDLGLDALNLGTGTHPAFKTNGADRGEILVGKYLASQGVNGGCSVIGGVQPKTAVDYDDAKLLCTQKGDNWHLMSVHEWGAIALWSLANGTVPRGNTYYGQSHEKKWETAIREDKGMPGDSSGSPFSLTGSGPNTWSHDHSEFGVQDLVGNVWEWLDQLKLSEGQVVSTLDNDASTLESIWYHHSAFFDSSTNGQSGDAGTPILSNSVANYNGPNFDSDDYGYTGSQSLSSLTKSDGYIESEILRRLMIETSAGVELFGGVYIRNYGDRFPLRGGHYHDGSRAGYAALNVSNNRSKKADYSIGFRPAYFI